MKEEVKKKPLIPEDDSFLEINKFELDREWMEQSGLYQRFSRIYAKQIEKLERADSVRKLTEAQLGKDVRENPDKYDLRKATDAAVKETVICHPIYQNAVADAIKATYNVALLKGTCEAIQQRKSSLENLVKLFLNNYWADPRSDDEEFRDKIRDIEKKNVRKKK